MLKRLSPIITASGLVLAASPVSLAVAQEAASAGGLEEVTVTGTFIQRTEGFTPASPVQEIAKEEFEAHAPRTVADFFTTQTQGRGRLDFTLRSVPARETAVLEILLRRSGNVAPKRLFEDHLFGLSGDVGSNAVEVYVHRLRKMLADAGATVKIHTVRGVGYLMAEEKGG